MAEKESLAKSYGNIEKQIKEELASTQKSLTMSMYIKIGVLVVIVIYMSVLWHFMATMDAKFAMEAILGSLKTNTEYRQTMVADLNKSAETNVTQVFDQLNMSFPQIRGEIEKVVFEKIDLFAQKVEEEFNLSLQEPIKAKIDGINNTSKDTPEGKLNLLMVDLRTDFKTLTYSFTKGLTEGMTQDLLKLNKDLKKLQSNQNLTEKEKYERQLICIWVKLLNKRLQEESKEESGQ